MTKTRNAKDAGFTLIELMMTVVILGIITAIAIPVYMSYRHSAVKAATQVEQRQDETAAAWSELMGDGSGEISEPVLDPSKPEDAIIPPGTSMPPAVLSCPGKVTGQPGKYKCHVYANGKPTGAHYYL